MADLSITAANVIAASTAPRADVVAGDNVILLGVAKSTSVLALKPIISGVTLE